MVLDRPLDGGPFRVVDRVDVVGVVDRSERLRLSHSHSHSREPLMELVRCGGALARQGSPVVSGSGRPRLARQLPYPHLSCLLAQWPPHHPAMRMELRRRSRPLQLLHPLLRWRGLHHLAFQPT